MIYAIGDVHGRIDLLRALLRKIQADWAAASQPVMRLVMLGDYIDRGPESRGVIDLLVRLHVQGGARMVALRGNHEQALLDFLADPARGPAWVAHGGRETLASYGVSAPIHLINPQGWTATRDSFLAALPPRHLAFLQRLELSAAIGGYVFVHAGLRPGLPLEAQAPHDLMWIRHDFLDAPPRPDAIVVHGHTPKPEPQQAPGRIGIDTGAYATGVLTALRLEGAERRFLQTDL